MRFSAVDTPSNRIVRPKAYPPKSNRKLLRDWLFERIHGNKLVYKTCWEDPRCDRNLMNLQADSEVVMITSAGCNALDYLLDNPAQINCIDVNPRQNALLHLKKVAIQELPWTYFFAMFGDGRCEKVLENYQNELREFLPWESKKYWDKNLAYFNPNGRRAGLYFHGSSGYFAWGIRQFLRRKPRLLNGIDALLNAQSLEEQKAIYFPLEDELLKVLVGGQVRQKVSLALLGVPAAQRELIEKQG